MGSPRFDGCAFGYWPLLCSTLLGFFVLSAMLSSGVLGHLCNSRFLNCPSEQTSARPPLGTGAAAAHLQSHPKVAMLKLRKQKRVSSVEQPSMEEIRAGPHIRLSTPPSKVAQLQGVADPSVVFYWGYYIAAYANAFNREPLVQFGLSVDGSAWEPAKNTVFGLKWISLFVYRNTLYLIGTQRILWELPHSPNDLQLVQLSPPPALAEVSRVTLTRGLAVHILNNVPLVQPDRVFFPFMVAPSASQWEPISVRGYVSAAGQEELLGEGLRALRLDTGSQGAPVGRGLEQAREGEIMEVGAAAAAAAPAPSSPCSSQGQGCPACAPSGDGGGAAAEEGTWGAASCFSGAEGKGEGLSPEVHIGPEDWDQVVFGVVVEGHPLAEGTFVRLEQQREAAAPAAGAGATSAMGRRAGQPGDQGGSSNGWDMEGGGDGSVPQSPSPVVYARVVGVGGADTQGEGGVLWVVPQRWNASCEGQDIGWSCKGTVGGGGAANLTTLSIAFPDTPLYQEFYLSFLEASNATDLMEGGAWRVGRFVGNPVTGQARAHRLWAGGFVQERREGGRLRRCTSTGTGECIYWQEPVAFASAHNLQPAVAVRITTDQNCNAAILCHMETPNSRAAQTSGPMRQAVPGFGQLQCTSMAPVPGFGNVRGFVFYDPPSSLYWAVSNFNVNTERGVSGKSFIRLGQRCIDERGNVGLFYSGDMHNWVLAQVVASANSNLMHLMYVSCAVGVPPEGHRKGVGDAANTDTHDGREAVGNGAGVGTGEDLLCVGRSNGILTNGLLAFPKGDNHDSWTVVSFRISGFRTLVAT